VELGRLEPVIPRAVWANEAYDFTPWLLGNADRLAEALGIDLELTASEHPVGGFSLDLIGRDLTNDCVLIVENQLEATDHTHLGQILTYAAGTAAATIVWVATAFRDEHRQTLDWLNERTDAETHFFGVQLRVVKIGDSQPAPLFDVVAQPNDWQKRIRTITRPGSPSVSGKGELYRQFWGRYLERVHANHPSWTRARAPQTVNWMSSPAPIAGCIISISFAANGRLRHELYIDTGDGNKNIQIFQALMSQRAAIENAYGRPLQWEDLPGRRACRIAEYETGSVEDAAAHDRYINWFEDCGVCLRRALEGRTDLITPEFTSDIDESDPRFPDLHEG
jgi:hypothetical protein